MKQRNTRAFPFAVFLAGIYALCGCTPQLQVTPPHEPITINLNVKIDHEVRVKVEKDLEEVLSTDSELF